MLLHVLRLPTVHTRLAWRRQTPSNPKSSSPQFETTTLSDTVKREPTSPESGSTSPDQALLSQRVQSLRLNGAELGQPTSGSRLPWVLSVLLAGSTTYFALIGITPTQKPNDDSSDSDAVADSNKGSGVSSATQGAGPRTSGGKTEAVAHESKGYIVPTHQILVSPKVGGMVKYLRIHAAGEAPEEGVPLEEGLHVNKGDVLAVLETTDYDSDVSRCRSILAAAEQKLKMERKNVPQEIERAQAELNEAYSQRDYNKTVLDRNTNLAKKGSVSPNELEKSQSEYDAARHRVERLERALELVRGPKVERIKVAEADVGSAKADLVKAEWRLDNCTIVAPITGTLLRKNCEEGNIVNPVAFNGSYSICDMADLANLEVDLSIQERDISRVFKNQKCIIRAEAYSDRPYTGYVSRLMPIADRAKGSVSVRVKIQIPEEDVGIYLKPEMGAVVTFYSADAVPPEVVRPKAPREGVEAAER